jgi:hypothetical protein
MRAMLCRKPIEKYTMWLVDSARTQLYASASRKPHGFDAPRSHIPIIPFIRRNRLSSQTLSTAIPLCSVGRKWVYIFNRRRAKKLIPDNNSIIDLWERCYEAATCSQLETKNLGHPRYGNVGF